MAEFSTDKTFINKRNKEEAPDVSFSSIIMGSKPVVALGSKIELFTVS